VSRSFPYCVYFFDRVDSEAAYAVFIGTWCLAFSSFNAELGIFEIAAVFLAKHAASVEGNKVSRHNYPLWGLNMGVLSGK